MYDYVLDFRLWLQCKGHLKLQEEYEMCIEPNYTWLEANDKFKSDCWFKSKQLAPMTIEIRLRSILSFYNYNDIIYVSMERSNGKPVTLTVNDGIPTKEEIREILNKCDPLEKAIVLVGASSGLASNEIINLRIKDFKNDYCEEDGIATLILVRQKTNYKFVTFLSREASEAVWDYLKYRDRSEKSKDQKRRNEQLYKQKVFDDEGYLFVSKAISDEYLTTHNEELRKLSNDAIQNIYRSLCEDTGLSSKPGNWNNMRSHKLRKWFSNKLREAKCDPDLREFMMGHKIEGSKGSYFVDDSTELKAAYKDCTYLLTIEKELDISESEDFKRIKAENKTLIVEAEKHRVERSELQALKAELEAEKAKMESFRSSVIFSSVNSDEKFQIRRKTRMIDPSVIIKQLNEEKKESK